MSLDPTWIALISTLCGGVGLKLAEHWLGRNKVRIDDAAKLRDELRLEITAQREEIKQLESDVDKWRKEYYDLRDKYINLQTELTLALQKIKDEATGAVAKADRVAAAPPSVPPLDDTPKM